MNSPYRSWAAALSQETIFVALLFSSCTTLATADDVFEFSGSIAIGSDCTFRGISQTMGSPAVAASLDIEAASGWYANAWASNVDFVPDGEPDDGARYELDLGVGYSKEIVDDWSVDIAFVRYLFPDTVADVDYDFSELIATLWYADNYHASVAFSDDVDGVGSSSVAYALGANWSLPAEINLAVTIGQYDLRNAYGDAYSYLETALSRSLGDATVTLAYNDTHSLADRIFDRQVTGSRVVLSAHYEW